MACELFEVYAPEPPWSGRDVLEVFGAMVRQISKLGEESPESAGEDFGRRFRIVEQLSEVKIGAVLVDLIRTENGRREGRGEKKKKEGARGGKTEGARGGDDDEDDGGSGGPEDEDREGEEDDDDGGGGDEGLAGDALEVLCDLVRSLLACVRPDHPPEVPAHAASAVAACLEEFEGGVPHQVLEELLACVGRGPVVWVTNPAFAGEPRSRSALEVRTRYVDH